MRLPIRRVSPSRELERAFEGFGEAMARAIELAPWDAHARSLEITWLDLDDAERARRMGTWRETSWIAFGFEPPQRVTRVRSLDGRTVAIRGAECWYEGPGYSNWAYVLVDGKPRTPGPDSSVPEDTGWYCWLDLGFPGTFPGGGLRDDTANDDRQGLA
jgi:hypothetical protein